MALYSIYRLASIKHRIENCIPLMLFLTWHLRNNPFSILPIIYVEQKVVRIFFLPFFVFHNHCFSKYYGIDFQSHLYMHDKTITAYDICKYRPNSMRANLKHHVNNDWTHQYRQMGSERERGEKGMKGGWKAETSACWLYQMQILNKSK